MAAALSVRHSRGKRDAARSRRIVNVDRYVLTPTDVSCAMRGAAMIVNL